MKTRQQVLTPPGATVTAHYLGREGKLFLFVVVACDLDGEIGRGSHKRAVITTERPLGGAQRRMGTALQLAERGDG